MVALKVERHCSQLCQKFWAHEREEEILEAKLKSSIGYLPTFNCPSAAYPLGCLVWQVWDLLFLPVFCHLVKALTVCRDEVCDLRHLIVLSFQSIKACIIGSTL